MVLLPKRLEGYVYFYAKRERKQMVRGPETNQYHKGQRRTDLKATEKTDKN